MTRFSPSLIIRHLILLIGAVVVLAPFLVMLSYSLKSPAEIERGQVYEFKLNHVMEVEDPMECVRTEYVTVRSLEEA